MFGSEDRVQEAARVATFDPALRDLLDHVAAELAAEYVRLVETAAQAEIPVQQTPDTIH